MDDMVYQCSNQNSIYVLNAGYNPTYGDFGPHASTGREMNGSRTTSGRTTSNSIGASCSSAACSLQHKFKTFGNSSAAAAAASAAAAITAPATVTTTTTNYVNPVATSMSTAMCSPATAALQKLFNCNVGGDGGGIIGDVCQNVSHRIQQQSHSSNSKHSNNNCPVGSHNNSCLSATASQRSRCDPHEGPTAAAVAAGGTGAGALPLLAAAANRKKCTNVKSTLIAKKTKFLKFLEEEKWRSSQQLTTDDAEACGATQPQTSRDNSNGADPYAASSSSSTSTSTAMFTSSVASSFAGHSASKNNNSNIKNHSNNSQEAVGAGAGAGAGVGAEQNKLNNWSMHNDNNNKLANYTQQQQPQQQQQQREREMYKQANRSSSYELYQEAADLLGLSCSLCDNCRCLDCQSGYFDCADDDDESYSEQSLMDEYDEYDYGYSYEEQLLLLANTANTNQPAGTQPVEECEEQELQLCYAVDCQQNCSNPSVDDSVEREESQAQSKSDHRLAIDFDLINATSSQVLENCVTFNDLSLLDAEQQVEPFT